jgi:hypothetical protein
VPEPSFQQEQLGRVGDDAANEHRRLLVTLRRERRHRSCGGGVVSGDDGPVHRTHHREASRLGLDNLASFIQAYKI